MALHNVNVSLSSFFQNLTPYAGSIGFKLNRRVEKDGVLVFPITYQTVQFTSTGAMSIDLIPNALLGSDTCYIFEVRSSDGKLTGRGAIYVPDADCDFLDYAIFRTASSVETAATAQGYASLAKQIYLDTQTVVSGFDAHVAQKLTASLSSIEDAKDEAEDDISELAATKLAAIASAYTDVQSLVTSASNYATQAASSATVANGYKNDAANSADAASGYKDQAVTAKDTAVDASLSAVSASQTATSKAQLAATSERNAGNSATQAASSAQSAATDATLATQARNTAISAREEAVTAKTAAMGYATSASSSADQASSSATNATTAADRAEAAARSVDAEAIARSVTTAISNHNSSGGAHSDIRQLVTTEATARENAVSSEADARNTAITEHDSATDAHADIRQLVTAEATARASADSTLNSGIATLSGRVDVVENSTESPVAAGKVWTSTADGAEWANPTVSKKKSVVLFDQTFEEDTYVKINEFDGKPLSLLEFYIRVQKPASDTAYSTEPTFRYEVTFENGILEAGAIALGTSSTTSNHYRDAFGIINGDIWQVFSNTTSVSNEWNGGQISMLGMAKVRLTSMVERKKPRFTSIYCMRSSDFFKAGQTLTIVGVMEE